MKSPYIKYLGQLLAFSGTLVVVALVLSFIIPGKYISPALPFIFALFISTSLLSFFYLLRAAEKRLIKFVNAFLLTIIFKLMVYAGVMVSYSLINRKDAIPFMMGFFLLYLSYTIFETISIISHTRPPDPDNNAR
jgi:hypothetical protein